MYFLLGLIYDTLEKPKLGINKTSERVNLNLQFIKSVTSWPTEDI